MAETRDTGGGRTQEQRVALSKAGRIWLQGLISLLRNAYVHDSENRIFDEPIEILMREGNRVLELEGRADFLLLEDQIFLNGLWMKPTISERESLFILVDFLRSTGIGGVIVRSTTTSREWRTFLRVFGSNKGESGDRVRSINAGLEEAGIEQIEVRRPATLQEEEHKDLPLPTLAYGAVIAYAKALYALREFAAEESGEGQVGTLRKAQRLICEMVDLSEKSPSLFLLLSLLKNFDSYFHHHCANVLVLSLALGRSIGMGRKELADLGMAALLHDVGKLQVPEDILVKVGELSNAEWLAIHDHPVRSAETFLTLGYLNESVAERALVAYQHHWASRLPRSYPVPRRPMTPSLMSSIVTICVNYDSLTSHKAYRRALLPHQAIRVLGSQTAQGAFRSDLVSAFLALMGSIPIGSWVAIPDKGKGLIAATGPLAPTPGKSMVMIVDDEFSASWEMADTVEANDEIPSPAEFSRALAEIFRRGEHVLF